ncbi:hypothetical protein [Pseudomonas sp.]|uniref:hypothetical protein n=1 Tax=Pseudomonas sp. TaxID=306 RepID=UPI0031D2A722
MTEITMQAVKPEIRAKSFTKDDFLWVLGIYGCAVGGGSLFWPISLGLSGFWAMLILTLIAFPITYYSYRVLCQYISSGTVTAESTSNIVDTTRELLGDRAVRVLSIAYFMMIFPSLVVYAITMSNTFIDFFNTQLGIPGLNRPLVVIGVTLTALLIAQGKTTFVVKAIGLIVFPFIFSLIFFGLMGIPHWNTSFMATAHDYGGVSGLMGSVWSSLPMVIYAFSFTPIVSSFVAHYKKQYGSEAQQRIGRTLLIAIVVVVVTVVFFAWSCIFALSPQELQAARGENLTALSYMARKFDNPWLAISSQIIIFFAALKAYLAQYLATRESLKGIAKNYFGSSTEFVDGGMMKAIILTLVFAITVIPAIPNLDIIMLIKYFMVPVSVFVVYFLPQYAFHKSPKLQHLRGGLVNYFVLTIGLLCLFNGVQNIIKYLLH